MKTISEWQKDFSIAANKKYPKNKKWSQQDSLLSILRQLGDVSKGIQWEQGLYEMTEKDQKKYKSTNHRIAASIADILILCEKRKMNIEELIEKEFPKVMRFFKGKK